MKSGNKRLFTVALLAAALAFLPGLKVFSYINYNQGGTGYEEGGESSASHNMSMSASGIEHCIIQGGASYLEVTENAQKILRLVELQDMNGINYTELNLLLDRSIISMDNAIGWYDRLVEKARATPYNQAFNARLKAFDYNGFCESHRLVGDIFDPVAAFLREGDITGLFENAYSQMTGIRELLGLMKKSALSNIMPELSNFWRLNEACSNVSMAGSYATRVFYACQ